MKNVVISWILNLLIIPNKKIKVIKNIWNQFGIALYTKEVWKWREEWFSNLM